MDTTAPTEKFTEEECMTFTLSAKRHDPSHHSGRRGGVDHGARRLCAEDRPLTGARTGLATHLGTTPDGAHHRSRQQAVTVTVTPLDSVNGAARPPTPRLYRVCVQFAAGPTGASIVGSCQAQAGEGASWGSLSCRNPLSEWQQHHPLRVANLAYLLLKTNVNSPVSGQCKNPPTDSLQFGGIKFSYRG